MNKILLLIFSIGFCLASTIPDTFSMCVLGEREGSTQTVCNDDKSLSANSKCCWIETTKKADLKKGTHCQGLVDTEESMKIAKEYYLNEKIGDVLIIDSVDIQCSSVFLAGASFLLLALLF